MNILGIDIGTTSVKIVLLNLSSKNILSSIIKDTESNINNINQYYHEQNVEKIFSTILNILKDMSPDHLKDVGRIGISGQMHGVVFWNETKNISSGLFTHSNLITWMDQRCNLNEFIKSLPKMPSYLVEEMAVSSGYGCASIYHKNLYEKSFIDCWKYAGTIVDYVVCQLCDICSPIMSTQMAHSWGYFDLVHNCWFTDILKDQNFPIRFLPEVKHPGSIFGRSKSSFNVIPNNAVVFVGMGDLQCSMYHSLKQNLNSAINMSTSSQFVVRVTLDDLKRINNKDGVLNLCPGLVINPFFNGDYMLVGASLNGGNVLENYVSILQQWVFEITNTEVPKSKIWSCLLSLYSSSSCGKEENPKDLIVINPIIFGERHCPNEGAVVSNIFPFNCKLADVYKSLCYGLVNNLITLLPREMIFGLKVNNLTCTGGLINRHKCVQDVIKELYGETIANINFLQDYDACVGIVDYLSEM